MIPSSIAPTVRRMIAYGKRTPGRAEHSHRKVGQKEEALKGLRKGRISYAAVARGHPHTHNLAREFTDDERRIEREQCASGSGFFYDAPTERHDLFGGVTYGIARRSASLSHRLSYDAPLVRKNRNSIPQAGEHDVCGLPSSAGEGWNEGTINTIVYSPATVAHYTGRRFGMRLGRGQLPIRPVSPYGVASGSFRSLRHSVVLETPRNRAASILLPLKRSRASRMASASAS